MPSVAQAADPEAAVMEARYDEHAAVLWRHALRLTGNGCRTQGVVQATLLPRSRQHPEIIHDIDRAHLMIRLSVEPRVVIELPEMDYGMDCRRSPDCRRNSEGALALYMPSHSHMPSHSRRTRRGDAMTCCGPFGRPNAYGCLPVVLTSRPHHACAWSAPSP